MADDKIILEVEDDGGEQAAKNKCVRVLVFSLGGEDYCIPIRQAKEAIRTPALTGVPNTPEFARGVVNLRGEILSVIDIRYFFGLPPGGKSGGRYVLITDVTGQAVGILADRIQGTLEVAEDSVQPPLSTLKGKLADYTKGEVQHGGEILTLLDLEKILRCEELEKLREGRRR